MTTLLIRIGVPVLTLVLGYWLFIVGEGTYLGRYAVRLIYQWGAPHYDRIRAPSFAGDETRLLPLLEQALAEYSAPRVLDVATGTGRVPFLLAPAPGFTGQVVGLDFAPAMLAQAQTKCVAQQLDSRITFVLGEASRLPWPDTSFDFVTCLEALEFFPHPRRALREMVRVLRPGGTLVVSKYPDRWALLLPAKGQTRAGITNYLYSLGLRQIGMYLWQPGHYELVIAVKRRA